MQVDEQVKAVGGGVGNGFKRKDACIVDEDVHHDAVLLAIGVHFVGSVGVGEVLEMSPEALVGIFCGKSVACRSEFLHLVAHHQKVDAHCCQLAAELQPDAA